MYVGIDLGGTNIKAVLLNNEFQIKHQYTVETKDTGNSRPWKDVIAKYVNDVVASHPHESIHCGIAAPGLANEENNMISWMPGRLHGLENLDWQSLLQIPVRVLNDAHAACLAEWKLGVGKGTDHMLMLTLGTGVGGGVILNGELFQGTLGRAGHFGHATLNYKGTRTSTNMVGSLEQAIGNLSIHDRTFGEFNDTQELVEAYSTGNVKATYWWLDSVNKLATSISSLINMFDAEMVVIGGGIANANEALFQPLHEFIDLYEWRPGKKQTPIRKAQLGEYAGAIGAAIFTAIKHNNYK